MSAPALVLAVLLAPAPSWAAQPPSRDLDWTFSVETSYPAKSKPRVEPKELADKLERISRLAADPDPLAAGCARAMTEFKGLREDNPSRAEVYLGIPTCRAVRQVRSILDNMRDPKDGFDPEGQLATLKICVDEVRGHYDAGEAFFRKAIAGSRDPRVWEQYLEFCWARDAFFSFVGSMMPNIVSGVGGKKAEAVVADWVRDLQSMTVKFDRHMETARRLTGLAPAEPRYKGMLGSLLVGKVFTTVAAALHEEGARLPQGQDIDVPAVIRRVLDGNASSLEDAKSLLDPLCQAKLYDKACQDLELAAALESGAAR